MPILDIARSYADGDVLFESDLDNIKSACETLLNTTLLDSDNIQSNSLTNTHLAAGIITATSIKAGTITTDKIAASNITEAKINTAGILMNKTESFSSTENISSTSSAGTSRTLSTATLDGTRGVIVNFTSSSTCGYIYASASYNGTPGTYPSAVSNIEIHKNGVAIANPRLAGNIHVTAGAAATISMLVPNSCLKHLLNSRPTVSINLYAPYVNQQLKVTELR